MLVNPNEMQSLGDWLKHPTVTQNSDIAFEFEGEFISYAQLIKRARQVANALSDMGVKAGDRVAIYDKNSHRYVETILGCTLIGAAPAGVNWRLAPPEVAYIVKDTQANVLLCGQDFVGLIENIRKDIPAIKHVIALGFAHSEWPLYEDWRDAASDEEPTYECQPDDTMLQLYTSGTTGNPKGAELTHSNVLCALQTLVEEKMIDWTDKDVNLVCMPLFHVAGSLWALLGLTAGCKNILMRDVDPAAILKSIEEDKVSVSIFVPAVILFLLSQPDVEKVDVSSLRQLTYGASPIPEDLLKRAMQVFGCDFVQIYGLTETTGCTTHMPAEDHRTGGDKLRSCGRANQGVDIEIRDEQGGELPRGEIGEIVTRGGGNIKGYWNLPEETAHAFRGGWFHTGDAGYMDEDGYVFIHDRIKDMIISGGENIYPAEIEGALFAHPNIADVAVVGIPDDKWGESVHAVVVLAAEAKLTLEELQGYAREHLAGYKIPRSMEFIEALPRNPTGKILRRQLREKFWKGKTRSVN